MRCRALVLGFVIVGVGAGASKAQTTPDTASQSARTDPRSGWLIGVSFGVPGYRSEAIPELFTIGFHGTQLRPSGQLGFDYSLGTMPRALGEGVLVLGFRAGAAMPLSLSSHAWLLPSAGVSLIGGAGANGGGAFAGLNAGIAAVAVGQRSGLRAGITWHRFQESSGAVWLFELGAVGIR